MPRSRSYARQVAALFHVEHGEHMNTTELVAWTWAACAAAITVVLIVHLVNLPQGLGAPKPVHDPIPDIFPPRPDCGCNECMAKRAANDALLARYAEHG